MAPAFSSSPSSRSLCPFPPPHGSSSKPSAKPRCSHARGSKTGPPPQQGCATKGIPPPLPRPLSPNRKSWIPGRSFRAFAQEEFTTCRALPEMCLRRPASLDESVAGASQPVQKPMKSSVFKPLDGGGGARVSQKGLVLYRVVPCCLLCVLFPLSSYFFFLRTQCRIPRLPTAMAAPRAQTRRGGGRLARNNQRWRGTTSAGAE